uniref:Uncharacterized protein n=1 Tax=Opuntia streptacantha TaxID=393608 RepID=A0A7C9E4V4_OPUST
MFVFTIWKENPGGSTPLSWNVAHVAIQGATAPHDMLPGTEGASDNQNVPPSTSSSPSQKRWHNAHLNYLQLLFLKYQNIHNRVVPAEDNPTAPSNLAECIRSSENNS